MNASLAGTAMGDAVTSSQKDFPLEIGRGTNKATIIQKRWYIENQHFRLADCNMGGPRLIVA